ncbi:MAG: BRO family protein [Eikenella sp.]|nr:BRO family protein [Eikenella sp.]
MNAVSQNVFQFNQSANVRTFADEKGEYWFLANDVCAILGYSNSRDAIAKHCRPKGVTKRDTLAECDVTKRYTSSECGVANRDATSKARKSQEMTYINEPNLYRLIIKSRKPEAEAFEEWVMEEVLPTIRQTGRYELHLDRWLSEWEREQIRAAVKERCARTGETSQAVYAKLHRFIGVPSYEQISVSQFQAAMQFLDSLPDAPELFRQPQGILITEEQLYQLSTLTRYARQMSELYHHLYPALRRLGSAYSGEVGSWAEVPHYWIGKMQDFLHQAYPQMHNPKHIEGVKANFALMS